MPSIASPLIQKYIETRNQFYAAGGSQFMTERQDLRSAYCTATVSKKVLAEWVEQHPSVKEEFTKRFQEWDSKIQKGLLTKSSPLTLSESDFMVKVDAFFQRYQPLLTGNLFERFTDAKTALRTALLPELKTNSVDSVAKKHNITDADILYRMQHEWTWKA